MSESTDLAALFGQVAAQLEQDRPQLNGLDRNGNAGDNMAANFALVSQVLRQQRDAAPADALQAAADALQERGRGRTATVYAQGLAQAAQEYARQGGQISGIDLLPLLRGLLGGAQQSGGEQGQGTLIDALIPAALAYIQAKRQGASETEALLQALMAARQGSAGTSSGPYSNPQAPQPADPGAAGVGSLLQGLLQALAAAASQGGQGGSSGHGGSTTPTPTTPAPDSLHRPGPRTEI